MDVSAVANEALSLISTLRELCRSVTHRIENYRANPQQLALLKNKLTTAVEKSNFCQITLQQYSAAIATESLQFELINLREMLQTIQSVDESLQELEQSLQPRRGVFKVFRRANRIAARISEHVSIVGDVSRQLNEMNEKLQGIAQENDVFRPDFNSVPNVRVPVYLDFSTRDTMEGVLKAKLFESMERPANNTQNDHRQVTAVFGVAGMGGVGKTTALIGLGQDKDVQEEFSGGGIYFVVVGKDANNGSLVASLKDIVKRSGGRRRCEEIDSNGSVESAVGATSSWFAGRKALFICDDLWKTSSCQTGYLNALVRLLDESPKSQMLISTRSSEIACGTSARIVFEPRSNTGREARGMFLASAGFDETAKLEGACEELVGRVLELCSGVPLMLSIAGARVRWSTGTQEASLKGLLSSLEDDRLSLPEKQPGQYPSCFNQAVRASLETTAEVLETSEVFKRPWNEYCRTATQRVGKVVDFVSDCFERLCVLPRSARVSEEIIFGIWCIRRKKLGWSVIECLVEFHLVLEFKDAEGNAKFGLHDVLLDYCEKTSQGGEQARYELHHREFLSHAWRLCNGESRGRFDTENTWDDCNRGAGGFWVGKAYERCRPWWKTLLSAEKVPGIRNYMLGNLFRHLKESGGLAEAAGLISHMGWTKLRVGRGGISALNADFSLVEGAIRLHCGREQDARECVDAHSGIKNIWDMTKKAWPLFLKYAESIATHSHGYLVENGNELPLVGRYLESATDIVTGPWLRPQNAFWRILDSSSNVRTFRTAERIFGIVMVMRSKSIVAATTRMLFWIDIATMSATREKVVRNEEGNRSEISAFAFCEATGVLVLGFRTGGLELRDEETGNIFREVSGGHEGWVGSVAISADGRTVVSGSRDKTVRVWDAESGSAVGEPLRGHEDGVRSVAISGDGRIVVSGSYDNTVRVWDTESGSAVGEPLRGHEDAVESVAISADGRTIVSGSYDKTVRVWDTESGGVICEPLRRHESVVNSVAISADGRTVVSGSRDKTVRVWDAESGSAIGEPLRRHEDGVRIVAISGDGRIVVSGSYDNTVRIWDTESGSAVGEPLRRHEDAVESVAISADGRTIVSGSYDKTVRVWDAESGGAIGEPLRGHKHWVLSVALSRDGRIVVSGSRDKTVRVWDAESGSAVGEPLHGHEDGVRSVTISADGRTIVSGSYDKTVRVWDAESGGAVGEPLHGHESAVNSVAISADGRTVVSGSRDKTVRIWDAESGSAVGEPLRGHEDGVRSVAISADGRTIVSGSYDKTVRVWDAESGIAVGEPLRGHEHWMGNVAISTDGRTVVSGSDDKTIRIWTRGISECHWVCSYVCSLPSGSKGFFAYQDGGDSSGVMGKVYCLFGRGGTSLATFELVRP